MKSLMQHTLGADWDRLPTALQRHYGLGTTTDSGQLDIHYPRFMQPFLNGLHRIGALLNRPGTGLATLVEKQQVAERHYWQRTIRYPDGEVRRFNSFWILAGEGQLIEFVNPLLGLQLRPFLQGHQLHYHGVRYLGRLGSLRLTIPEWLGPGHATIIEEAIGETRFRMDFRLQHPLFGETFRYSGEFTTHVSEADSDQRAPSG